MIRVKYIQDKVALYIAPANAFYRPLTLGIDTLGELVDLQPSLSHLSVLQKVQRHPH